MHIKGIQYNYIVSSLIFIIFWILSSILGNHLYHNFRRALSNSSSFTSCPAVFCFSVVWLVCMGGVMYKNDVGSQRAENWFRGKFANVLARLVLCKSRSEKAFH